MSLYSRLRMHLPNMNSSPVNPRLPEIRVSRRPSSLFTPFSRKAHFSRRPTRVFRAVSPFALFPSRRRARVRHQRARARRRWRRRRPLLSPATRRRKTTASMPTDDQVSSTERETTPRTSVHFGCLLPVPSGILPPVWPGSTITSLSGLPESGKGRYI